MSSKRGTYHVDSDFSYLVLTVYKLTRNDFHSSATDVVHPLHPQHLIFRFEGFRYALFFGKLFYQPRKYCFSGFLHGLLTVIIEVLFQLCKALDISLRDFFDDDNKVLINDPLSTRIYRLNSVQREALLAFLNTID